MEREQLVYLAKRLDTVATGEFCGAADLIRKVLSSKSPTLLKPEAEHALYHALWDFVSRAIDLEEYTPGQEQQIFALESEMAGRVLSYRLAHGWIGRTNAAPTEFHGIDHFL